MSHALNPADPRSSDRTLAREMIVLAAAVLVTIVPVTLVVPVLKGLVQDAFGLSAAQTSWFMSINMVGAFFAAPIAGLISDRMGRRKPLIVGALAIDAVLLWLLPLAPSYGVMLGLRLLEGAAHIFALSLVLALAADLARRSGRSRVMAAMGATLTLGVALGAPLGGILGKTDPTLPLQIGAGLGLFGAAFASLMLHDDAKTGHAASLSAALRLLRTQRDLLVPYGFAFADRFTVGFFVSGFPLFLGNVHGLAAPEVGKHLGLFLMPFAALCYPVGRYAERRSLAWFIGGGSLLYGIAVCGVGVTPLPYLPFLMVTLGVLSSVMFVPTLMLTGEISGARSKATAMGGFNAAGSLGFLMGPVVFGQTNAWVSASAGEPAGYTVAFVVAGLSQVLCVAFFLRRLVVLQRARA